MALFNINTTLAWFGVSTQKFDDIDILSYRNQINSVYHVEDVNSDLLASKKASLASISQKYRYLESGTGGLIFVTDTSLVLDDGVKSVLTEDSGRIIPTYIEKFSTTGTVSGHFVMTTDFKNKKPIYKNAIENWFIWYDAEDEKWIASQNDISKNGTYLMGDSCLPNYLNYTNDAFSSHIITTENQECVSIDEFDGVVESANGIYCQTGSYNDQPVYVSCDGKWYLYFDFNSWVLTDSPYNRDGSWIANGSNNVYTKFNNSSNENGSASFQNQIGVVKSLGIPNGAIMVEDGEDVLFTENDGSAVTGEGV